MQKTDEEDTKQRAREVSPQRLLHEPPLLLHAGARCEKERGRKGEGAERRERNEAQQQARRNGAAVFIAAAEGVKSARRPEKAQRRGL